MPADLVVSVLQGLFYARIGLVQRPLRPAPSPCSSTAGHDYFPLNCDDSNVPVAHGEIGRGTDDVDVLEVAAEHADGEGDFGTGGELVSRGCGYGVGDTDVDEVRGVGGECFDGDAVLGDGLCADQGFGGGVYVTPGGIANADAWTFVFGNDADVDDDVFGILG